jgi:uncharacterized membrane protein
LAIEFELYLLEAQRTQEMLNNVRWGVLGTLLLALVGCTYAGALSVVEMSHSVVGGTAGLLVALLLVGAVGWRFQVKWKQLRRSR